MRPLDGNWLGIVGGTNIGRVSASLQQAGAELTGQFVFEDLLVVPLQASITGAVTGRRLEGTLSGIQLRGTPPVGMPVPRTGRVLGVVEEDGNKISGFWMTDVMTAGGFILLRES